MPADDLQPSVAVDPAVPNVARIYDYFLGGTANFPADREAGEAILRASPEVRPALRANRSFLGRVVRFLAGEAGITQFIDLGAGLPTQGSVHQAARSASPAARVAYVDSDAAAVAQARALLAGTGHVSVTAADLRRPADVLADPELGRLIDLTRPVAVLMFAVLHFVGHDEDAPAIVARYRDALPPGSYLAMSLGTSDGVDPAKIADAQRVYRSATAQLTYRTRAQIQELFRGFELVEPGLVQLPQWRPDATAAGPAPPEQSPAPAEQSPAPAEQAGAEWLLGGVGLRKA